MNPADVSSSTGPLTHYFLAFIAFIALLFLCMLIAIRYFVAHEISNRRKLNRAIAATVTAFSVLVCAFLFIPWTEKPRPVTFIDLKNPPQPTQPERGIVLLQRDESSLFAGSTDGPPMQPVDSTNLISILSGLSQGQKYIRVFVKAGSEVRYKVISDLFDTLRANGYLRVSLVGNEPAGSPPNQSHSLDAQALSKLLPLSSDSKR